jgi:hypothetical protein
VKWQLLLAVLWLGFAPAATSADTAEPVTVDAICGKLVSIEETTEKGSANGAPQDAKPIPHIRLRLFSPTASADCCALITPVAEVTTGRDGTFQFRKPSPGDYWLVATIGGAEYKLLIRYQPGKKGEAKCSEFLYALEKGQLHLRSSSTAAVATRFS